MKAVISSSLFCMLMGICGLALGQNSYAVHFKYKPQEGFSLDNPVEFISSTSLDRKARFRIALDSADMPVSSRYLSDLQPYITANLYNSTWLNAAIVTADQAQVPQIASLPFVEKVVLVKPGPNHSGRISSTTDKKFTINTEEALSGQRLLYDAQNAILGIDRMHEEDFKGRNVTIAVFDAGFPGVDTLSAFRSIYAENRLVGTRNFVSGGDVYTGHQHGTNVLSLIGAHLPPDVMAGAPESKYILCLTEDVRSEFKIEEYNWVRAAEYSDSLGVDIINSSVGYWDFDDPAMDYTLADLDGETAVITRGATIAAQKGILIVNSAGNYGRRGVSTIVAPADARGILSVGAVNQEENRADFSSQGPTADGRKKPELVAMGQQVNLLLPSGAGARSSGTSFAAPQIAALAAGLWEARPEWSKDELIEYLLTSASNAESPDNEIGHGIPDFIKAYYGEVLNIPSAPEETGEWRLYPNPMSGDDVYILFGQQFEAQITLYDISGKMISGGQVNRGAISEPYTLHLPGLRPGVYLVEVRSDKAVRRVRLIKK